MKKGDTWVSAVLYIALGAIVVSMLLAAGMPVINRVRDKNTFVESKEVMLGLNSGVRRVMAEGTGSQRSLSVDLGKGEILVDALQESVTFTMESKVLISELDLTVREGDLQITSRKTNKASEYIAEIKLNYNGQADLNTVGDGKITGRRNIVVRNVGRNGVGDIMIEIRLVS